MRIAIQPFGYVSPETLQMLVDELAIFPAERFVNNVIDLPQESLNPRRGQHKSQLLLETCIQLPGDKVLGITAVDLYAEPLNFVFGQAEMGGRAGVISIARLSSADRGVFRARVAKEAIHELGHTFGLAHCNDPRCVMRFSNSLADTDRKERAYCRTCLAAIPRAWSPRRE